MAVLSYLWFCKKCICRKFEILRWVVGLSLCQGQFLKGVKAIQRYLLHNQQPFLEVYYTFKAPIIVERAESSLPPPSLPHCRHSTYQVKVKHMYTFILDRNPTLRVYESDPAKVFKLMRVFSIRTKWVNRDFPRKNSFRATSSQILISVTGLLFPPNNCLCVLGSFFTSGQGTRSEFISLDWRQSEKKVISVIQTQMAPLSDILNVIFLAASILQAGTIHILP